MLHFSNTSTAGSRERKQAMLHHRSHPNPFEGVAWPNSPQKRSEQAERPSMRRSAGVRSQCVRRNISQQTRWGRKPQCEDKQVCGVALPDHHFHGGRGGSDEKRNSERSELRPPFMSRPEQTMSIIINNITPHPTKEGTNLYSITIGGRVVMTFNHERKKGLAQCLRDAAEELDKHSPIAKDATP